LRRVGPVTWQALYFSVLGGIAFLAMLPLFGPIVALGRHEQHLQVLETTFLRGLAFSGLPTLIVQSVCGFFAGRGCSRVVLVINVSGMLVYFVLASLLIFGNTQLGIPPYGIAGAAWATVGGSCVSALLGLVLMFRPHFEQTYAIASGWRFDAALFA